MGQGYLPILQVTENLIKSALAGNTDTHEAFLQNCLRDNIVNQDLDQSAWFRPGHTTVLRESGIGVGVWNKKYPYFIKVCAL